MICSKCGKDVESGMRFCSECGQPMPPESAMGGLQFKPPTLDPAPTQSPPISSYEQPPLVFTPPDQHVPSQPPTSESIMNHYKDDADLGNMAEPPFQKNQSIVTSESVYESLADSPYYERDPRIRNNRAVLIVAIIASLFCLAGGIVLAFYSKISMMISTPQQFYISQEYVALKKIGESYLGNTMTQSKEASVQSRMTFSVPDYPLEAEKFISILESIEINTKAEFIPQERYAKAVMNVLLDGTEVTNMNIDMNGSRTGVSFPDIVEGMLVTPFGLQSTSRSPVQQIREAYAVSDDDFSMLAQTFFKQVFIDSFPSSAVTEGKGLALDKHCDMVTFDFNKESISAMRGGMVQYLETNREKLIPIISNALKVQGESLLGGLEGYSGGTTGLSSDLGEVTRQFDTALEELKTLEIPETSTKYTVYYNNKGRIISRVIELNNDTYDSVAFNTYKQDDVQIVELIGNKGASKDQIILKNESGKDGFSGAVEVSAVEHYGKMLMNIDYDFKQVANGAVPMMVGAASMVINMDGDRVNMNLNIDKIEKNAYKSTIALKADAGGETFELNMNIDLATSRDVTAHKIEVPTTTTMSSESMGTVMEKIISNMYKAIMQ